MVSGSAKNMTNWIETLEAWHKAWSLQQCLDMIFAYVMVLHCAYEGRTFAFYELGLNFCISIAVSSVHFHDYNIFLSEMPHQ